MQLPAWPGIAHDLHGPHAPSGQHTPSVQWPLMHWVSIAHARLSGCRSVQVPPRQLKPVTHSGSAAQVVRQVPATPQRKGEQLWGVWRHVPSPSQAPTGVNIEPVHEELPQLVDVGALAQAPRPSQRPVNPHGGAGVQPPCGSMSSAGTGWHVPAVPSTLHERQLPQLEEAQQTPSMQLPLSHSLPAAQICPKAFLPHAPALQTLSPEQSASLPQAALQVMPLQT
jgi:hypothetical protein